MESLPEEVLLNIFRYFNVQTLHFILADVSTQWRRLARETNLNHHIELSSEDDFDFLVQMPMKEQITSITVKDFIRCENLQQRIIELLDHFPDLDHFTCQYPLISDTITAISERCTRLKSFDILPYSGYTAMYLSALRNLEIINVNICTDCAMMQWVAEFCHHVKEAHYHYLNRTITSEPINHLLRARRDHLTKLTLKGSPRYTFETIAICTNLKSLVLRDCSQMMADGLLALLALKQLSVLHVTGTSQVDKINFDTFVHHLDVSVMIDLNLSNTPFCDSNAKFIADKQPPLRKLMLASCLNLTAFGVFTLRHRLKFLLKDNVIDPDFYVEM